MFLLQSVFQHWPHTHELAITLPCPTNLINYKATKIVITREVQQSEQNSRPTTRTKCRIFIKYIYELDIELSKVVFTQTLNNSEFVEF